MDSNTVKELAQMLLEFLNTTGKSLATQGFQIALRYTFMQGVLYTIFALVILGVGIYLYKWSQKQDEDGFGMFFLIISMIFCGLTGYEGLMRLFATEWYAIKNIIELF